MKESENRDMKQNKKKMRTGKPLSLKTTLLLILIPVIFLYTLLLTVISSGYIVDNTKETLKKTLTETAQITAEHISSTISSNKKLTKLLASRVGSQYGPELTLPYEKLDIAAFEEEIASLGRSYGFLHMMVADAEGFTRTANHTDLLTARAEYYCAVTEQGAEVFASDITLDQGTFAGKYVQNYSAPIRNSEGTLIGVLVCKSDAAALSELVKEICVGEQGSTFIMDNRGRCIAHKNEELLYGGVGYLRYKGSDEYQSLNALWDAMTRQSSGYMSYAFNGNCDAAFMRIAGTNNWSVAVSVSENEFLADAYEARSLILLIGAGMIILFSLLLALLFRITLRGIQRITKRFESLSQGNLSTEIVIDRSCNETYRLSQASQAFVALIRRMIDETGYVLGEISVGNLTVKPGADYPGDFIELKRIIESNILQLNEIIQRIARTSEEVARGSSQMASGASGLAQGASEQASSIEELFATASMLSQRSNEIGGIDRKRLADIQDGDYDEAEEGDQDEAAEKRINAAVTLAEKLTIAIGRIAEASADIRRIASGIESISAETGMLALNASVEATHAGEAGRGFSVIAAEIRNLSDKSREAARDADNKIDGIARAVKRGTQTVELTVATIGEMTLATNQVKSALEQISGIVENIAATAEETAAGSEELSAQAGLLKSLVSEFQYNDESAADDNA